MLAPLCSPVASAEPSALTMTCGTFLASDDATQLAVVKTIIAGGRTKINEGNWFLAQSLAKSACKHDSSQTVDHVLGGS